MLSENRKMMRDIILIQAKSFLEEFGEFYPFGSVILSDGELRPFSAFDEDEHPEVSQVINLIHQSFRKGIEDGKYIAVSMAVDVKFTIPETGEKEDAIEIRMDSKDEGPINFYIPYRQKENEVSFIEMYADSGTLNLFKK